MSIASEITRINGNIAAAYTALDGKGATLPETQNSANLADTIDTITTGGGGGSNYEYTTLRAVMDKITDRYTYKQAYDDGWSFCDYYKNTASSDTSRFLGNTKYRGLYFDYNLCPNVIYVSGMNAGNTIITVKAPSGAVVTDATVENGGSSTEWGSRLKIDFTNATEKWIIIPADSALFITANYIEESQMYNCTLSPYVTWLELDYHYDGYSSSSKMRVDLTSSIDKIFTDVIRNSYVLKGFNISDNIELYYGSNSETISANVNYLESVMPVSMHIKDSLVNLINNRSIFTYGVTKLSTSVSNTLAEYYYRIKGVSFFPFVIDWSTNTLTGTFYINTLASYVTSNSGVDYNRCPYELFIIPSSGVNMQWVSYRGGYSGTSHMADSIISPASLTFLATNSPNVSSKTLKIGKYMKETNATAVATLESKGWTVQ